MSALSTPTRPLPVAGPPTARRTAPRSVGAAVAASVLAVILTAVFVFHASVPDIGGLGLFLDTALPWLGIIVLPTIAAALVSRRRGVVVLGFVPAVVWALIFVPVIVPLNVTPPAATSGIDSGTGTKLTVASQNIEAGSGTAAQSAETLAAAGADVIALEEMTSSDFDTASSTLAAEFPYSYGVGTVGLWSKYPVINAQPLTLGLGWNRALAADLQTPQGLVSIYVIHAASARLGAVSDRDSMLSALAETLPRDENERIIAVGDFNAASTDRSMSGILSQLSEANQSSGLFGNTWPSAFPLTRLDHVLERGMDVTSNTTLEAGASDHRAILTTLTL